MKRRIFLRCFLITLLSVLIVFISGIGITYVINRNLVNERLITETRLASSFIDGEEDYSAFEIFRNSDACRVTIILLPTGEVLYDSDTHESLENHLDREEVIAAINGKPTTVQRFSETFGYEMTYYAEKSSFADGREIIVRLAIRSAETNSYIFSAIPFLLITLLLSAVVAIIFARYLSRGVAERINNISVALKSVSDGDYIPLTPSSDDSEFISVYEKINELNERIVLNLKSKESERERLNTVLKAEKELARQKEEFFANASHELKTPLTAMVGLTELIMARETDPQTHKQAERIHKESLRLSDLISDMLKLSRLETVADNEINIPVAVEHIAEEVISELSGAIKDKNIKAQIHGAVSVMANEKRIYEILQNLTSNAVNYNKPGGTIDIILEEISDAALIKVCDSGIGIAEENIPYLCERFYRVDKSRSKKTGGTGLGLAIVKHICALYGAGVTIKSELSVGTEVTISFPKAQ